MLGAQEKEREINRIECRAYELMCHNVSIDNTKAYIGSELINKHGYPWYKKSQEAVEFIIEQTYKNKYNLMVERYSKGKEN